MTVSVPAPQPAVVNGGGHGVSRWVVGLSICGTVLLALGAFWLSFTTLRELAAMAGVAAEQTWVWPLIVDGVIVEATISVVALRNARVAARRFAWLLLAAGAAVSVAANITHAIVADTAVPSAIAAVVASVPPLVLLAMTHLTVELTRNTSAAADNATRRAPTPAETEAVVVAGSTTSRRGSASPRSLPAARKQVLTLSAAGGPKRQIAAQLGVHPTTVGRWLSAPPTRAPEGTEGAPDHGHR